MELRRLVWLLNLLCVSALFPGARTQIFCGRTFNTAHDSVKMVMDSATGAPQLCVARPDADLFYTSGKRCLALQPVITVLDAGDSASAIFKAL